MGIDEVKNYLNITWDDAETDKKVAGIMERAESTLNTYAGVTEENKIDFSIPDGFFNQIYLDCCRYIYNNSFEDFKVNFLSEINTLRLYCQVKARENAENAENASENQN